ncbi:MAG: PIN domain-containing protein [Verrucomicrobiaceae bacterium]|nr:PIN domain-containing protein [Verrucomicrobiaceae bacterium]
MVFFDTNIYIYVVSAAVADQRKKHIAQRLIADEDFGLSVQVLQEFMHVTLRKQELGLTRDEISRMIHFMAEYPVVETTVSLARKAFDLKHSYQISYWDAAILAAAQELNCDILYTEDLNHGQNYDGVEVNNPFLAP